MLPLSVVSMLEVRPRGRVSLIVFPSRSSVAALAVPAALDIAPNAAPKFNGCCAEKEALLLPDVSIIPPLL
jgi:hypothetical protein